MATSGTITYTQTALQLIERALRTLGVTGVGSTANANHVTNATTALNSLLKSMQNDGVYLWTREVVNGLSLAAYSVANGQTFGTEYQKVESVQLNYQDDDTYPLEMRTIEEYMDLPRKDTDGRPTDYYTKENLGADTFFLYPAPDDLVNYTLDFVVVRLLEDIAATSNNFDLPSRWLEALHWGLVDAICMEHGKPIDFRQDVKQRYKEALRSARKSDTPVQDRTVDPAYDTDYC